MLNRTSVSCVFLRRRCRQIKQITSEAISDLSDLFEDIFCLIYIPNLTVVDSLLPDEDGISRRTVMEAAQVSLSIVPKPPEACKRVLGHPARTIAAPLSPDAAAPPVSITASRHADFCLVYCDSPFSRNTHTSRVALLDIYSTPAAPFG